MNLKAVGLFLTVALRQKSIFACGAEDGLASNKRTKGSDFSLRFT